MQNKQSSSVSEILFGCVLLFLSHYRELLCERRMSFWRPQKERFVTSKAMRMERQKQAAYSLRHRKAEDVKCAVEV